jgi:hypothetical protein
VHGVRIRVVGDGAGGRGGGDDGHVIVRALGDDGGARTGGHVADDADDARVDQGVVARDRLGGIAFLIVVLDLDLLAVDAALGVQLLDIQVDAVLDGQAVLATLPVWGPSQPMTISLLSEEPAFPVDPQPDTQAASSSATSSRLTILSFFFISEFLTFYFFQPQQR